MKFQKTYTIVAATILIGSCSLIGHLKSVNAHNMESKDLLNSKINNINFNQVTEMAYEVNEEVSLEEQQKEEKKQRDERMQAYSIYQKYGLTYDKEKDKFFYYGEMVRYFSDEISDSNTRAFSREDGIVDVKSIRDAKGNLIGLKKASDIEFQERTDRDNKLKEEFRKAGATDSAKTYEINENYKDESLLPYTKYGTYYDEDKKQWMYNKKVIHFFYDPNQLTFLNEATEEGIYLKVIRNQNGTMEEIVEMSEKEMSQIIN